MENVLNYINQQFIALRRDKVKANNEILNVLISYITMKLREDTLFGNLFQEVFYGGSFYDNLRLGQADEYDLHLILKLPELLDSAPIASKIPGYIRIQSSRTNIASLSGVYSELKALFSEKGAFLSSKKVLQWTESLMTEAVQFVTYQKEFRNHMVTMHKNGPAFMIKVLNRMGALVMDVDLVVSFVFSGADWPEGFRQNPVPSKITMRHLVAYEGRTYYGIYTLTGNTEVYSRGKNFMDRKIFQKFFVLEALNNSLQWQRDQKKMCSNQKARLWRVSFQKQEREMIEAKQTLKPTIKLLKKLRDTQQHSRITSYFIKNAVLVIDEAVPNSFWDNSLTTVFLKVLQMYQTFIDNGNIPYYWMQQENLLQYINDATLNNFGNRLQHIIDDVEHNSDPSTVAKYLLNKKQYKKFLAKYKPQ